MGMTAAAEAILLATAIAKSDEQTVLAEYNTIGGRRRVENRILGHLGELLLVQITQQAG